MRRTRLPSEARALPHTSELDELTTMKPGPPTAGDLTTPTVEASSAETRPHDLTTTGPNIGHLAGVFASQERVGIGHHSQYTDSLSLRIVLSDT